MDFTRTLLGSRSFFVSAVARCSAAAPLLLAGAALLAGPAVSACDGSAPGVILGSDTEAFAFTDAQSSETTDFRLTLSASAVEGLNVASLGLIVDVVVGGPELEVVVTPPTGSASSDSVPETVMSSNVTYDRYVVSLGDVAPLCSASGACSLEFSVLMTRTSAPGVAFTATATISGVITGDVFTSDDVALDFF